MAALVAAPLPALEARTMINRLGDIGEGLAVLSSAYTARTGAALAGEAICIAGEECMTLDLGAFNWELGVDPDAAYPPTEEVSTENKRKLKPNTALVPRRSPTGFSLVEVLAATVVTSLFTVAVFPLISLSAIRLRLNERVSIAATLVQKDLDTIQAIAADPNQYLASFVAGSPNSCDPISPPYADDLNIALTAIANTPIQGSDPDYVVNRRSQVSPNGVDVVEVTYAVTFRGEIILDNVSSELLPRALLLCPS